VHLVCYYLYNFRISVKGHLKLIDESTRERKKERNKQTKNRTETKKIIHRPDFWVRHFLVMRKQLNTQGGSVNLNHCVDSVSLSFVIVLHVSARIKAIITHKFKNILNRKALVNSRFINKCTK
jgi:hypothetical protein